MEVVVDGKLCSTREDAHLQLKEKLNLPEYYGMNLDALYDCVSVKRQTKLIFLHWETMIENIGHYGQLILQTLSEAAEENPGFEFVMEEDSEDDVDL